MKPYNWRKWRAGFLMVILLSLAVAGSTALVGGNWKVFLAAFCAAFITNMERYLKTHPIEDIASDTTIQTKDGIKLIAFAAGAALFLGCTTIRYSRTEGNGDRVKFSTASFGTRKAFDNASLLVGTNSKSLTITGYANDQTEVVLKALEAAKSGFDALKAARP